MAQLGTVTTIYHDCFSSNSADNIYGLDYGYCGECRFKICLFFIQVIMTETQNISETQQENSGNITSSAPEKETKWYVLRVVSGKEKKVKEYLDKDIIRNGWDKLILQVFLPVEKVYKVQNGKKSDERT
jgi:hypothetical protein